MCGTVSASRVGLVSCFAELACDRHGAHGHLRPCEQDMPSEYVGYSRVATVPGMMRLVFAGTLQINCRPYCATRVTATEP